MLFESQSFRFSQWGILVYAELQDKQGMLINSVMLIVLLMSMNLWTLPNLVMKLSSYPDTIIKWNSWHKQRTFLVILKKLKIMVFMTSELFFYWNSEIRSIVLLGILSSVYWHSKINSQQWNSDECRSYFIVIMIVLACKMSSTWEQFYLIYNADRGNNFVNSAIIWVYNTYFFAVAKVIASLMKQLSLLM